MSHGAYYKFVKEVEGPMAKIRTCALCLKGKPFSTVVRKGIQGVGRGYGMSVGNKARGEMIQHLKTAHPAEFAQAVEEQRIADAERIAKRKEQRGW